MAGPICVSYLDAGNLLLAEALREVPGAQLLSSASFWFRGPEQHPTSQ